ncbi:flagellar export chaperone FliS [Heyndrickxia shackletonii]|uniref:Flagellar secretion chaperone FliS n=1 Tax=Heyndrickxia shackletonii TaxID=157838 RepID=A0A0Q3TG09_9BACI|nr:flagellar export chaperone FliS [Heyndrickxia shackletonii]KQL52992.1 flagellar export chaperone FliS [Heyndrickxia shackletonii]NEY98541.1 flagellar export chaperone FliS [Heyndrickxia shackletonii]
MNKTYEAYQQVSVTTATPGELVLMLYNGCIKFIKIAKNAMNEQDIEKKHLNITKAQNIIKELIVTLNMDYEISKDMRKLYDYMNRRLIEANIKNDTSILDEVEHFVEEFRDTWKEVIKITRKSQFKLGETV